VEESLRLLRSNEAYEELVERSGYPFGTGDAAKKIVAAIKEAAQKGYLRDVLGGGIK
jgi:UDP-N-acetylglucosamine 2-epimerase